MNSPSTAKSRAAHERAASYNNPNGRPGASARVHGRTASRQESPFSRETTPIADGRPAIKPINKSHVTTSEIRTERTSVVTRDKIHTKRPAKESVAPGSPRDWDKNRIKKDQNRSSSIAMVAEKPQAEGSFACCVSKLSMLTISNSTMESNGVTHSSLRCTPRLPRFHPAVVLGGTSVSSPRISSRYLLGCARSGDTTRPAVCVYGI